MAEKKASCENDTPDEQEKGGGGGMRNARPEVKALSKITQILDALTTEQRDLTLGLVGRTYDLLNDKPPSVKVETYFVRLPPAGGDDAVHVPRRKATPEEIEKAFGELRKPPEPTHLRPPQNDRHLPTPGGYTGQVKGQAMCQDKEASQHVGT